MKHSIFKLRHAVAFVAIVLCALSCESCKKDTLSVNPSELTFTANESGSKTVNVSTNASPWVAIATESWIHASQDGATTILSVSVDSNPSTENSREGQIVVTAGEAPAAMIKITQAPRDKIDINSTSLSFEPNDKVEKRVSITTNASEWSFTPPNASWLECSKNGNELIVKPTENNSTSSERSATISITAGSSETKTLTVIQKQPICTISPTGSITFPANAASTVVTVTSNTDWTAESSASWLTMDSSSGSGNGSFTVRASANSGSARTGTITVKAPGVSNRTVTVTQESSAPASLTVSPTSISFTSTAQSRSVTVTSNISWTAVSNSTSWLTVSPASGSSNGSITVSATANTGSSTRTGKITVSGSGITREITVSQSGQQPPPSPQAQVRFRKTSNNASTYEMAVVTTSLSELAYYQFGTSTGTTSYYNIPSGTHHILINQGGEVYYININGSRNINFQANHRYTFEYDGSNYTLWDEGTYSAPQQTQTISTKVTLERIENRTSIR